MIPSEIMVLRQQCNLAWFYSALSHYAGTYTLTFRKANPADRYYYGLSPIEVVKRDLGSLNRKSAMPRLGRLQYYCIVRLVPSQIPGYLVLGALTKLAKENMVFASS